MSRWLILASLCALVPLLTGLAIFRAWLWLGWDSLQDVGLATIQFGLVLFLIGSVCLFMHVRNNGFVLSPKAPLLVAVLLLANFPAAFECVNTAIEIKTRHYVTVENASEGTIEAFTVTGSGVEIDFGRIAPNTTVERWFHPVRNESLSYVARIDGAVYSGMIDGYVMPELGASYRVLIQSDNLITVRDTSQ